MPRQKSNKKEHEDLKWLGPNFAYVHGEFLVYVHGERTWERFINNLIQRDLTFLFMQQEYSHSSLI